MFIDVFLYFIGCHVQFNLKAIYSNLTLFADGAKPVEGRCAVGDYNRYIPNLYSHVLSFVFIIFQKIWHQRPEDLMSSLSVIANLKSFQDRMIMKKEEIVTSRLW